MVEGRYCHADPRDGAFKCRKYIRTAKAHSHQRDFVGTKQKPDPVVQKTIIG